MIEVGVVDVLLPLLTRGPRQFYHATRTLVYLGQLHLLKGCGLFDSSSTDYESDSCVTVIDADRHSFVRLVVGSSWYRVSTYDIGSVVL